MTKTDMLFIRATKKDNSYNLLKRVYSRYCALPFDEVGNRHLVNVLSRLCEQYVKPTLANMLGEVINPYYYTPLERDEKITARKVVDILSRKLRYLKPDDLGADFITPLKFRIKENKKEKEENK